MADDLSVAIERLRNSTQLLNSACDAAALTIRETESFLEECRVGMFAEVSLGLGTDHPEATEPDWEAFLCYYQQQSGKYRIGCMKRYQGVSGTSGLKPWAECSRDEKLNSFSELPGLIRRIAMKVDEVATRANRTVDAVASQIKLPKKKKGG